jgi:hypothetical protein
MSKRHTPNTPETSVVLPADMREPWERQPGEGNKPFQAFQIYLKMGVQRSYAKVARRLGKSATIVARWAGKWKWSQRCTQFLDDQTRRDHQTEEDERRRRVRRHTQIALSLQQAGLDKLPTLKQTLRQPRDIISAIKSGVDMERRVMGDERPPEAKPLVTINLLQHVQSEVDQKRKQLMEEGSKEYARCVAAGMSSEEAWASVHKLCKLLIGHLPEPPKLISAVSHSGHPSFEPLPEPPPLPEPVPEPEIIEPEGPGLNDPPTVPTPAKDSTARPCDFRSTLPPRER